jgi:RNA polymerase sigma-70 factor (ECF subfamily)
MRGIGSLATPGGAVRTVEGATFEDLVASTHGRLYGALCLMTRDRHEAEDVMQEAFLRVWERWDRVGAMADPAAYLYRTAFNAYRRRLRRASLAVRRAMNLAPPPDELEAIETREIVVRALGSLTPRQREALVLTDLLDLSSEDAGRLMGIEAPTVRVLASQGRKRLREMSEEGALT